MPESPRTSPTQPSVLNTRLGIGACVHWFKSCFKPLLLTALLTANLAQASLNVASSAAAAGGLAVSFGFM